jgi:hypothetical protein
LVEFFLKVCDRSGRKNFTAHTRSIGSKTVCPPLSERKPELIRVGASITSTHLSNSAKNFFTRLRSEIDPQTAPLVLALDEAHVMSDRKDSVSASLLDIFSSVLADLKNFSVDRKGGIHFATIFLSTNSELNKIAATPEQIASQRATSHRLAGALTCIPFDVFVDKTKNRWTVAEISTLKFIGTFGRPL